MLSNALKGKAEEGRDGEREGERREENINIMGVHEQV